MYKIIIYKKSLLIVHFISLSLSPSLILSLWNKSKWSEARDYIEEGRANLANKFIFDRSERDGE